MSSLHTRPPDVAGPQEPDRGSPSRSTSAAVFAYLRSVAAACDERGLVVTGIDNATGTDGHWSGRLELFPQHLSTAGPAAVELRWSETTGWEVALQQPSEPGALRYLHLERAPAAQQVAAFVAGLLRGEELGMVYPARFREADTAAELMAELRRHTGNEPGGNGASAGPARTEDDE